MTRSLDRMKELMENGYVIEDIDSTDDAIHIAMSGGEGTLMKVVLDREDARAILKGEASWLDSAEADDFMMRGDS